MSFVCLIEIHLHFPTGGSLKGKRRELVSLKAQLQRRFGAAVAETDHQDLWQRATLAAALVAGSPGRLDAHVDKVEGWLEGRFPQGVVVRRTLASWDDLVGIA